jgi:putative phosphoserine phosphatase/1-acylglycerol-3-phosphate O-acyltransferase
MGRIAAIFDLDRTLLRGASGRLINDALKDVGLRRTKVPGEAVGYRLYELFGESPLGIGLARAAALAVRGWPVEVLGEAGRSAVEHLVGHVAPYAPALLEEHRQAGHLLVLATTTPEALVRPLADRLGIDEVVATRYASVDGAFTGRLEGRFVWGMGKLSAVRERMGGHDVTFEESFAYSASINDLPLLSAVGNPRAVNPDLALHAVASIRRWPIIHLEVPPGVPTLAGLEAFDLTRLLLRPELFPFARFDIEGIDNIPDSDPFILASNHRSYFDVAALALVVARKGRPTRFLAKAELFEPPLVGHLARALGGIPVERAGSAASALVPAERVLRAGEGLVILPEGTIPRGEEFFDPVLHGKTGAARLAAATGAAVVPVGLWNTEAIWPRSARLPRLTRVLGPPTVTVRVGPPVAGLGRRHNGAVADTRRIMAAIAALLPDEARTTRQPRKEELSRSYPPGKTGEERVIGLSPPAPAGATTRRDPS